MFFDTSMEFLERLLKTIGPSGFEFEQSEVVSEFISQFTPDVSTDVLGNTLARFNRDSDFQIILSAHYDEIGLQITSIANDGLLAFHTIGQIPPQILQGAEVDIISNINHIQHIQGIICVQTGFDSTPSEDDLWIDIGASSIIEAQKLVTPGDIATFRPNFRMLSDTRICSKGLDNKIGTFIVAEAYRKLVAKRPEIGVVFMASVREEIGICGAKPAAAAISPDVVIVVDVANTTDTPGMREDRHGRFVLGDGPGLCLNSDNNRTLLRMVQHLAKIHGIPIQTFAGSRDSGGNDLVSLSTLNAKSAAISLNIPCHAMHSPDEICDLNDVEAAVRLLVETVSALRETEKFAFCGN